MDINLPKCSPCESMDIASQVQSLWETASLGKGPLTLGKGFAEGGPRQRALGEF